MEEDKTKILLDDLFKFVHRVSTYEEKRNAAEIAILPAIAELLLKYNWLRLQLEAKDQSTWGQKVVHNAESSIKAKADVKPFRPNDEDDGKFIHHEIILI